MAKVEQEQRQQPPDAPKAREQPEAVEGSLRGALNTGDYGVDYQRSDYSQDAEHDEATHAENAAHRH
jgi:hypothetical protein